MGEFGQMRDRHRDRKSNKDKTCLDKTRQDYLTIPVLSIDGVKLALTSDGFTVTWMRGRPVGVDSADFTLQGTRAPTLKTSFGLGIWPRQKEQITHIRINGFTVM